MITGVDGIGVTEVRMSETVEKTLAIEAKTLVIVVGIIATAEKIIRIAGGVGVQIIRIPRDTDATTGKISMETGNTRETNEGTGVSEEILRVIKDYGAITKGIFKQIVGLEGTTNDIIRQGQIAGTDPLLNITGINIPADLIKREAGVKLADVRFF
ncbi:MAG: hypothetical protein WBM69_29580 [Desulfobacterales bacterium]